MIVVDEETYSVSISYGDADHFTITFVEDDDGNPPPEDGTEVLVTLKKKPKPNAEAIWEKRLTIQDHMVDVVLNSEDTKHPFGQYYWDVRVIYEDNKPHTPMLPASFTILEVVGDV